MHHWKTVLKDTFIIYGKMIFSIREQHNWHVLFLRQCHISIVFTDSFLLTKLFSVWHVLSCYTLNFRYSFTDYHSQLCSNTSDNYYVIFIIYIIMFICKESLHHGHAIAARGQTKECWTSRRCFLFQSIRHQTGQKIGTNGFSVRDEYKVGSSATNIEKY